jgi:tRNA uridine 5-carbamoylmethylation protein Kti12
MKNEISRIVEIASSKPTVIVLVGLPGCGKSTFLKLLGYRMSFVTASTDNIIEDLAKNEGITYTEMFNKINFASIKKQMDNSIHDAVKNSQHVAIDQTNMGKKKRMSLLEFFPVSWNRVCVVFDVDEKIHNQRLSDRAKNTGKVIPEFVMKNMISNYNPPTKSEGFDFIFNVNNTKDIIEK